MFEGMSLDALSKDEATMGDTRFFFQKMPFDKAILMFENIRYELRHSVDAFETLLKTDVENDGTVGLTMVAGILKAVLGLHPTFVMGVKNELWRYTQWYREGVTSNATQIYGEEDAAFNTLTFMHSYEVLVRALAVNFLQPLREWLSQRQGLTAALTGANGM